MIAEEYGIVLIPILFILHQMYTYSSLLILTYVSCFMPVSAMNEKTYDMHSADNTRWY